MVIELEIEIHIEMCISTFLQSTKFGANFSEKVVLDTYLWW